MIFYFLYNALLVLLWPIYQLLSLFVPRVRQFRLSRNEVGPQSFLGSDGQPVFWLHAASVGEMDQALAIARELKRRGGCKIALSVFSLSVKKLQQPDVDFMFRAPVDFPWAWKRWVKRISPAAFVTMTWDVFPNLLASLRAARVPSYLACAALSHDSSRLKFPLKQLLGSVYNKLSGIGAVDLENAERFRAIAGSTDVRIIGDSRYDAIFHKIQTTKLDSDTQRRLSSQGRTWILASTYRACDQKIFPELSALLRDFEDLRVLVFPHFVEEERLLEVEEGLRAASIESRRFSDPDISGARVVIVDRMGILALAYRLADFCYVGGGFHHRIHNTGEPAALGLPILTGTRIETSPIALLLEKEGALYRCEDGRQIIRHVRDFLDRKDYASSRGRAGQKAIEQACGSSRKFVDAFLTPVP
ncbi:MAG TPA: glycosyltransferase N-terminal domain-containing protein [Leptospiraceae bacterium]|nr:glycosyltransferase N-terminal domain-containing protein [Leptospiraceae bacterium]